MDINEFTVGATYRIRTADWEAPTGLIAPGKEIIRRVIEPANATNSEFEDGPAPKDVIEKWQQFLRVQCLNSGKVHLLHPNTIDSAEMVD